MDTSKCVFPDPAYYKLGDRRKFVRDEPVCVRKGGNVETAVYVKEHQLTDGWVPGPVLWHDVILDSDKKVTEYKWVDVGKYTGTASHIESDAFKGSQQGTGKRRHRKSRKQLKKRRTTRKR